MAQIEIKDLSFTYPEVEDKALNNINVQVEEGEFVVICGQSGCGKTTLIKNLKKSIAPYGKKQGNILFNGTNIEDLDLLEEAKKIGYVFQQPQHQLVSQNVWHELFFGLENLGIEESDARLMVAEVADYFGFSDKLYMDVNSLSGGQKQLLNVAAIMAMQPEVIILDEPTAQLDPVTAENFLASIHKLNRDFGVTIIISEHRLEKVYHMASKVVALESGRVIACGKPRKVASDLRRNAFFEAMPESVKLYRDYLEDKGNISGNTEWPLTVAEAKRWLAGISDDEKVKIEKTVEAFNKQKTSTDSTSAISVSNVWFRYKKESADILKGTSIDVRTGEIFGIVGGNGSGKSTLLQVMANAQKPYRGKVKINGSVSMMVQDVTCIFKTDTVLGELEQVQNEKAKDIIIRKMKLTKLLSMHPYDLSGGEQQRLAMAKLLLNNPDIIILDEPTKGMDDVFKKDFEELLTQLQNEGKTIVIVSHDIEFLAQVANRCGMMFDGEMISVNETGRFLQGKRYYNTEINKILNGHRVPFASGK